MCELTDKDKIDALERVLLPLISADEVRYRRFDKRFFIMEFVGADPNRLQFHLSSGGFDVDWDAEPCMDYPPEHLKDEFLPTPGATMVGRIYIWKTTDEAKYRKYTCSNCGLGFEDTIPEENYPGTTDKIQTLCPSCHEIAEEEKDK